MNCNASQRANGICYQVCPVTANGALAFQLSGAANADSSQDAGCTADYLSILAGIDTGNVPVQGVLQQADRYCGGRLNAATAGPANTLNAQICSKHLAIVELIFVVNGAVHCLISDGEALQVVLPHGWCRR